MKEKISRENLAQLGIIIGQLTHLQPAVFRGNKVYILDGIIYEDWVEAIQKIVNEEIKELNPAQDFMTTTSTRKRCLICEVELLWDNTTDFCADCMAIRKETESKCKCLCRYCRDCEHKLKLNN